MIANSSTNEKDYLEIKLKSDAFEDGTPFFYKENPEKYYQDISEIHKILYRLGEKNKPSFKSIVYKKITDEKYIDTLVELHKEWSPFQYDRVSFKKYFVRENYILIGAFIKIGKEDFLIGSVSGEMINEIKFRNFLPGVLKEKKWYDFSNENLQCGFLQNIGVIDEYRKLGVGTELLDAFTKEVQKRNGVVSYLNVICYNNSAVKFFGSNKWHFYGDEKNYYRINGKVYDARVFYYVIDLNKCDVIRKQEKQVNKVNGDGVSEISIKKEKGCIGSIMSLFGMGD